MNLALQRSMFEQALDELERDPVMTNQVLEISFIEADNRMEMRRYRMPRWESGTLRSKYQTEVMATVTQLLSLEEFRSRYSQQKPYFEYWFGEAIQKTTPTWLHAVLQGIMREALRRAGYKTGSEVQLRIDSQWEPVADVIATLKSVKDYPIEPVEIVVEILSPDDRLSHVVKKCHHYERIGTERIFVLDPVDKLAWQWKSGSLEAITQLFLLNGAAVALEEIWRQLEEQA